MICPKCDKENDDNWPIWVNDEIEENGCQECWEEESDEAWWEMVIAMDRIVNE